MEESKHRENATAPQQPKDEPLHSRDDSKLSLALVGTEVAWFSDSPVRRRLISYTQGLQATHVIIFTTKKQGYAPLTIGENVFVHPTNSVSRLTAIYDAAKIIKSITGLSVISAQDPFESGFAVWLSGLKVPIEIQLHTDLFDKNFYKTPLNFIRMCIARFTLPTATTIRAVSERIKHSLPKSLQQKTFVLPIYTEVVRNESKEAELREKFAAFSYRVLMVSRLEPEKQIAQALSLFAKASAGTRACLIIVGSGKEEARLRAKAVSLGISDKVFFEQWQNPDPYYRTSDLLLHTAKYEGYGLVLVEARRLGLPVLSTDVGVAREIGARVASLREMASVLANEITVGKRTEAPFALGFGTISEYSDAIRDRWKQAVHTS